MKPQVIILFLFSFISIGCGHDDLRHAKIDHLLTDLYQQHLFNGAIVVGEKGKIIFSKGYGYSNFPDSTPFTPETASDGGSIAKTITATAILLLAEEGRLKLTESVQRYLPNYPYSNTTVWNLITHSSGGLPDYDYFFENAPDTAVLTTSLNLNILDKNKPALYYPPGANIRYDNVAFDLAALIVEKITRKSYEEFLKQRIFDPLQMHSSFIRPARFSDWNQSRTIGYNYAKDTVQLFDIADREGFYGGCNIWFTATDLYRWGQSFYHPPILNQKLIDKASSGVVINGQPSKVRMGAWYGGKATSANYYWGNVAGFYSWVYWDREKQFTIAFMTNTNVPQWVRPLLTSALVEIMSGDMNAKIVEPPAHSLYADSLNMITGTYEIQKIGKVRISMRESRFVLRVNDGMEYEMHKVDQKRFYVPAYDPWISFQTPQNGKFQNINWSSTTLQTTGKRISK